MKKISSEKTARPSRGGKKGHCHTERDEAAYSIFFETLANPRRLRIINALREGDKNVSMILESTGLEQTCVSHCLRRLERCGFVTARRDGKFRVYTLNKSSIEPLMDLIDSHVKGHCIHLVDKKGYERTTRIA